MTLLEAKGIRLESLQASLPCGKPLALLLSWVDFEAEVEVEEAVWSVLGHDFRDSTEVVGPQFPVNE